MQAVDVLLEAEDGATVRAFVRPNSLKNTQTVVQGVRQNSNARLVESDKFPVSPNFLGLFDHGYFFLLRPKSPVDVAPALRRRSMSLSS